MAPHASSVTLCLFDGDDASGERRFALHSLGQGLWAGHVPGVGVGQRYGYRVAGRWAPELGLLHNPAKLLLDPYAKAVTRAPILDGALFSPGFSLDRSRILDPDPLDSAPFMSLGVVTEPEESVTHHPRIPWRNTVIYECHVKGITALCEGIPEELRGTYAGLAHPAAVDYLKRLGITAVELLPIQAKMDETFLADIGLTNYWGYSTLDFFAPEPSYATQAAQEAGPQAVIDEVKGMVAALHEAGIEVILDVVYNHTAEGGNWGGDPNTVGFTSLGGFAAAEYYVMTASHALVDGATGTSNQLNYSSPVAQQLVLDSLEYWTVEMGVDGFRFDLATVLGRKPNDADREDWDNQKRFYTDHPLLTAIAEFAEEQRIEVIAEAWDLWGYEVGNFPQGWAEWNGRYRDAVRRFAKGDGNTIEFLDVVNGDHEHFADNGGPQKTINFIDAHDGFNMADLVSYQEKNNGQPYPFGPSDGGSDGNLSWDSGGSRELRRQRIRNFLTILYLSRGVPMFVAGDEFGRTQNGNNNPWEIDSVAMWNNYAMIPTNAPQQVPVAPGVTDASYHDNLGTFETEPGVNGLFRFTRFLANLRQRHETLQQKYYGDLVPDDRDVSYLFHTPSLEEHPQDGDRALSVYINSPGDNFLMMINMADAEVEFNAPVPAEGRAWRRLIDTGAWAEPADNSWPEGEGMILDGETQVQPWSVVVWHDSPIAGDAG